LTARAPTFICVNVFCSGRLKTCNFLSGVKPPVRGSPKCITLRYALSETSYLNSENTSIKSLSFLHYNLQRESHQLPSPVHTAWNERAVVVLYDPPRDNSCVVSK
jgi:hypothetical protein